MGHRLRSGLTIATVLLLALLLEHAVAQTYLCGKRSAYFLKIPRGYTVTSVKTIAGQNSAGGAAVDSANPAAVTFNTPSYSVLDIMYGVIYVSDKANHKIRAISAAGVTTTFAGTGTASSVDNAVGLSATFNLPTGLAINYNARVMYVAGSGEHKIRRVTLSGTNAVAVYAGSSAGTTDNPNPLSATFNTPTGLAYDHVGQKLYIADTGNSRIRRMDIVTGAVTTVLERNLVGLIGILNPLDVAFDPISNAVYISDTGNNAIVKLTADTLVDSTIATEFHRPRGHLRRLHEWSPLRHVAQRASCVLDDHGRCLCDCHRGQRRGWERGQRDADHRDVQLADGCLLRCGERRPDRDGRWRSSGARDDRCESASTTASMSASRPPACLPP
jgi:hypothetical protein